MRHEQFEYQHIADTRENERFELRNVQNSVDMAASSSKLCRKPPGKRTGQEILGDPRRSKNFTGRNQKMSETIPDPSRSCLSMGNSHGFFGHPLAPVALGSLGVLPDLWLSPQVLSWGYYPLRIILKFMGIFQPSSDSIGGFIMFYPIFPSLKAPYCFSEVSPSRSF